MTWSLAFARDPERVAHLTELNAQTDVRWDGTGNAVLPDAPTRQVLARTQFTGPPGQEQEAAEAWAFEMKAYFHRGVGEPPVVAYEGGVYTVTGLIQTTHPGDVPGPDGIVQFT
jgi:hypothetical protein